MHIEILDVCIFYNFLLHFILLLKMKNEQVLVVERENESEGNGQKRWLGRGKALLALRKESKCLVREVFYTRFSRVEWELDSLFWRYNTLVPYYWMNFIVTFYCSWCKTMDRDLEHCDSDHLNEGDNDRKVEDYPDLRLHRDMDCAGDPDAEVNFVRRIYLFIMKVLIDNGILREMEREFKTTTITWLMTELSTNLGVIFVILDITVVWHICTVEWSTWAMQMLRYRLLYFVCIPSLVMNVPVEHLRQKSRMQPSAERYFRVFRIQYYGFGPPSFYPENSRFKDQLGLNKFIMLDLNHLRNSLWNLMNRSESAPFNVTF